MQRHHRLDRPHALGVDGRLTRAGLDENILQAYRFLVANYALGDGAAADPTQRVSPSAYARWDRDPSYRPSNLAAFFRRTGDARA